MTIEDLETEDALNSHLSVSNIDAGDGQRAYSLEAQVVQQLIPWPMQGRLANNRAHALQADSPTDGMESMWSITMPALGVRRSACVDSQANVYTRTWNNNTSEAIVRKTASDGTEEWEKAVMSQSTFCDNNPALGPEEDYVFTTNTVSSGTEAVLIKIDVSDGSVAMSTSDTESGGNLICQAPTVKGSNVYFSVYDSNNDNGYVYAYTINGSQLWRYEIGMPAQRQQGTSVDDNHVYVGTQSSSVDAGIDAIADDGTAAWTQRFTGATFSTTPAVGDTYLYTTDSESNIYALDPADGSTQHTGSLVAGSSIAPVYDGTYVYATDNDASVYAFDSTLTLQWEDRRSEFGTRLVVTDDNFLMVCDGDGMKAYEAQSGTPLWRLTGYSASNIPPIITGEHVYAGDDRVLHKFKNAVIEPSVYIEGAQHTSTASFAYFSGSVITDDDIIILPPLNASFVGRYDPATDTFTEGASHGQGTGNAAFGKGLKADDGTVIFIPRGSSTVGRYDPATDTFTDGDSIGFSSTRAYVGGVKLNDGTMVFAPSDADDIGLYDPSTDTFSLGDSHGSSSDDMFRNAVLADNGDVIFPPHNSQFVGIYDHVNDVFTQGDTHGGGASTRMFEAGIVHDDGTVIMPPHGHTNIGLYDVSTDTYSDGPQHANGSRNGGFTSVSRTDGGLYVFPPYGHTNIGLYDASTNTYSDGPQHTATDGGWTGVSKFENNFYFTPRDASFIGIYR